MAISFGIGAVLLRQLEMVREMGDSVVAFYAADTGIEQIMMTRESPSSIPKTCFAPPNNNICYKVDVYGSGTPNCPVSIADYFCIRSLGSYRNTRRAIEVSY